MATKFFIFERKALNCLSKHNMLKNVLENTNLTVSQIVLSQLRDLKLSQTHFISWFKVAKGNKFK